MSTAKRIRKAAQDERLEITDHAFEEMKADGLVLSQVRKVLLRGALLRTLEDEPPHIRYVMRGTLDDIEVDVVCRFLSSDILRVITVYWLRN